MARDSNYDRYKKQKSQKLKRFRHYLEYLALLFLRRFARVWTLNMNQRFGVALGWIGYHAAKKDRGIARYQVDFCYPALSDDERKAIVKQSFYNTGKTFFETLMIDRIRKRPERYIALENADVLSTALERGNGAVLLFGHIGNWELLPTIYDMLDVTGVVIGSPIGDSKLDDLLVESRQARNAEMLRRGDRTATRKILGCFRNNGVLLFAIDQDSSVKSVFVDFFGKKASTAKGAVSFAQKFEAPVVSAFGARMEDGTHKYVFSLLSEPPYQMDSEEEQRLTQRYTSELEKHIRRYPSQWVWFHRRWKSRPEDESNPDNGDSQ